MSYFLHILLSNVLPIGIMISVGFLMGKKYSIHAGSLSKLVFNLFMPIFMFALLLEVSITWGLVLKVVLFSLSFTVLSAIAAEVVIRLRKYNAPMRGAMRNTILFYNSGNYMIPLNQLVFSGNPVTLAVQIIVSVIQNLLPGTYGIYNANAHKGKMTGAFKTILLYPGIYAVLAAVAIRLLDVTIPEPIYLPLEYISNATIALALITLGVQLSLLNLNIRYSDVLISSALRLLAGPLLGFGLVKLIGFDNLIANALVLSCAAPTSLICALIAMEYDNEPDFSAHAVLFSTVASMLTVTVTIFALG
ncbi:AEC family transporter [Paenibacillus koleovorans]|uniref:AEC family transporter n=1 Tax=Paenibacillus koleovorans TaxID=121608 RepID=UPI000FD9B6A0|nr:AEC family transporter [Paenibacillus koleovorans]